MELGVRRRQRGAPTVPRPSTDGRPPDPRPCLQRREAGPNLRRRCEGHPHRGLLHPGAEDPWRAGGEQPRRDRTCAFRRVRHNRRVQRRRKQEADGDDSDGIARVYGMNNVQAEELVEYATPQPRDHD
jgi:hypothetical protein